MWQCEKVTIKHKKTSKGQQVSEAFTAFNNTYVFVCGDASTNRSTFIHSDSNGNILFTMKYKEQLEDCFMLSDQQVVMGPLRTGVVNIIDLKSHSISSFKHQHLHGYDQDGQNFSITKIFQQTRCMAVVDYFERECCGMEDAIIKYYDLSRLKQQGRGQLGTFQFQQHICICSSYFSIMQANKHSMFVISITKAQIQPQSALSFITVKLNNQLKVEAKEYLIDSIEKVTFPFSQQNMAEVKQIRRNVYVFTLYQKIYQYQRKNHICSAKFNQDGSFLSAQKLFTWDQGFQIDFVVQSDILIVAKKEENENRFNSWQVLTIRLDNGEAINRLIVPNSPLYRTMKWRVQCPNLFLKFTETKSIYICDFIVTKLALQWTKGQIAMFFLLHINQDFDDDLLMDAYELLSPSLLEQELRINESLEPRLICKELTIEENPYNFKLL